MMELMTVAINRDELEGIKAGRMLYWSRVYDYIATVKVTPHPAGSYLPNEHILGMTPKGSTDKMKGIFIVTKM